ncbi:hypothetical protein N657DRAFT_48269 [Parathielavia appendiculata]|uniref:BTB domain-containing protein n=1 Tax=Parathielavia appendiculata TaxID=2587402 RepID=A0AAN6Z8X2_9PEZI|nr:hypothetical protein N657DRAFT_48269 [Parathielavia appendiculata]
MVRATCSSAGDKPISWTNEAWNGDPSGEVTLEFEGYTWAVKRDVVVAQFPWIKAAMATTKPGCQVVVHPCAFMGICPRLFSALLQYLHTNELPSNLWEDQPSFLTFVNMYYVAERFGMTRLKLSMIKCVDRLARHVLSLPEHHCSHCPLAQQADPDWEERQHLASLLRAVLVVEEQPWSAKMIKAVYDAGDRMKIRLMRLPEFCDFVERFAVGNNFARAIGMHRL